MRAPFWTLDNIRTPGWRFPSIEGYVDESARRDFGSIGKWFGEQLVRSFLWENAAEIREELGGQFGIKGITSVEDAKLAAVDRRKP